MAETAQKDCKGTAFFFTYASARAYHYILWGRITAICTHAFAHYQAVIENEHACIWGKFWEKDFEHESHK